MGYRHVSFYARVTFRKMWCKLKWHKSYTKFPFKTACFLVIRGLTTLTYAVYDYTTTRHMDL